MMIFLLILRRGSTLTVRASTRLSPSYVSFHLFEHSQIKGQICLLAYRQGTRRITILMLIINKLRMQDELRWISKTLSESKIFWWTEFLLWLFSKLQRIN
jgi:hypothetical protein